MAAFPASASGVASSDQLVVRAAASTFLGRCRGQTRVHTESDLRIFLLWRTEQNLILLTEQNLILLTER